jgi:hypothetical protein
MGSSVGQQCSIDDLLKLQLYAHLPLTPIMKGQALWCTTVIPAMREVEVVGSWSKAGLRTKSGIAYLSKKMYWMCGLNGRAPA